MADQAEEDKKGTPTLRPLAMTYTCSKQEKEGVAKEELLEPRSGD
ncbi:unnamed protein product [marine sediment metagenome]|uniref:Uncharacterized protein n=1 Tax=marine sediment metagenome TaxID=412755 RepID=X1C9Z1_9ZZZZ